jgi:hypothetical protein
MQAARGPRHFLPELFVKPGQQFDQFIHRRSVAFQIPVGIADRTMSHGGFARSGALQKPVFLEFILQSAAAYAQSFGSLLPARGHMCDRLPDKKLFHFGQRSARAN